MKEIIGLPTKSTISKLFMIIGEITSEKQLIADSLNSYFVNVGSTLDSEIPRNGPCPIDFCGQAVNTSIFLAPVVPEEISDCIKHLKDGSPGHDQIKPEIINHSREAQLNPLTYIFN